LLIVLFKGFLPGFSTDFPDLSSHSTSSPTNSTAPVKKINGHIRNLSLSSQTSEQDSIDASIVMKPNLAKHARKGSETSINSNASSGDANPLVRLGESWDDIASRGSSSDLYSEIGPSPKTKRGLSLKRNIALEVIICSCQVCSMCNKVIYDEEIMGAWSADDSNLNIL